MKRHFTRKCLLLFFCCLLALTAMAQSRGASVVLISIDGLKPDYILDADQHKLKVPNLRRILAEGAYAIEPARHLENSLLMPFQ